MPRTNVSARMEPLMTVVPPPAPEPVQPPIIPRPEPFIPDPEPQPAEPGPGEPPMLPEPQVSGVSCTPSRRLQVLAQRVR